MVHLGQLSPIFLCVFHRDHSKSLSEHACVLFRDHVFSFALYWSVNINNDDEEEEDGYCTYILKYLHIFITFPVGIVFFYILCYVIASFVVQYDVKFLDRFDIKAQEWVIFCILHFCCRMLAVSSNVMEIIEVNYLYFMLILISTCLSGRLDSLVNVLVA